MHRTFPALAIAALLGLAGCGLRHPGPTPEADRLSVLLLNGGGTPQSNYWSHLQHITAFRDLFLKAGVPADRIWILASDGMDPAPDLALRQSVQHDASWVLGNGRLDRLLGAKTELVTSAIPDVPMERADEDGVQAWFDVVAPTLRAGDTLLIFVTDHGTLNREDPADNRITLWGPDQTISVRELRGLLADRVPIGVRTMVIMSQCYSGSFAHLTALDEDGAEGRAGTPVCGYFSTTADRQAYGCYPEAAEDGDRGHAIRLADALTRLGGLPAAHEAALVWDDAPDVPLRTSDVYLEGVLRREADRSGRPFDTVVDDELSKALEAPGRWEAHLRLLDDLAAHYGLFSPRRLAELNDRTTSLSNLAITFGRHRDAWRATRASAADANAARWQAATDEAWTPRLTPDEVNTLDPEARRRLRSAVLDDLGPYTEHDRRSWERLARLERLTTEAEDVTYRTEIRLAVLLRMRILLIRMAGESFLDRSGTPGMQRRFADLVACEQLSLRPAPRARRDIDPPKSPLPSVTDDEAAARAFLPSWLGVKFQTPPAGVRDSMSLPAGAAFVGGVFEGSAAERAGLRPGDVIVGPPDQPFSEPQQLREWTMLQPRGAAAHLGIIREGHPMTVSIDLQPFPTEFPSLPAPPGVGEPAPPISLTSYREPLPHSLASGRRTLLFFWATWCGYCKAALPALETYAGTHNVDIIAITDESPALLDSFFASHRGFFPARVAIDPARATFLAYGVNGMPTFVLVGPDGVIERQHTGFDRKKGLPF